MACFARSRQDAALTNPRDLMFSTSEVLGDLLLAVADGDRPFGKLHLFPLKLFLDVLPGHVSGPCADREHVSRLAHADHRLENAFLGMSVLIAPLAERPVREDRHGLRWPGGMGSALHGRDHVLGHADLVGVAPEHPAVARRMRDADSRHVADRLRGPPVARLCALLDDELLHARRLRLVEVESACLDHGDVRLPAVRALHARQVRKVGSADGRPHLARPPPVEDVHVAAAAARQRDAVALHDIEPHVAVVHHENLGEQFRERLFLVKDARAVDELVKAESGIVHADVDFCGNIVVHFWDLSFVCKQDYPKNALSL